MLSLNLELPHHLYLPLWCTPAVGAENQAQQAIGWVWVRCLHPAVKEQGEETSGSAQVPTWAAGPCLTYWVGDSPKQAGSSDDDQLTILLNPVCS